MRLISWLPPLIFAVIAATLLFTLYSDKITSSPMVGQTLPAFKLTTLDGGRFDNDSLRGKVAIINMFADWCAPCAAEQPLLAQLTTKSAVPLYGIAWHADIGKIKGWLKKYGNPYKEVAIDTEGKVAVSLGVTGVPETYIIDRHGMIMYKLSGPLTEEVIEAELLPLLRRLNEN